MDIRLIGSPDVVQAWAGMLRDNYGVKTTLMRSRKGDDLRCYAYCEDEQAMIYADRYRSCHDDVVDAASPPTKDES